MSIQLFSEEKEFVEILRKYEPEISSFYIDFVKNRLQTYLSTDKIELFELFLPDGDEILITKHKNELLILIEDKSVREYLIDKKFLQKKEKLLFTLSERLLHLYYLKIKELRSEILSLKSKVLAGKEIDFKLMFDILSEANKLEEFLISMRDCFEELLSEKFLNFVVGDVQQLLSEIESLEDHIDIIISLHYSVASHKLDESLGRLTILSTIFLPATLIASIYGMNFRIAVPSWFNPNGFYIALLMMIFASGLTYVIIKKKLF